MTLSTMPRRNNDGLVQPIERPALLWLAQRMPVWVTPDLLTAVGFFGACVAALSYALVRWDPSFLWLASLGLVINWFGDSLDGNLARFREIERPRYGFFLDQNLDAVAQILFAIGIGASGLIRFELAMLTLSTYFLLSILSLVRAIISNVFAMTYGTIGLTELRIAFIILNMAIFFIPPQKIAVNEFSFTYPEILSFFWAVSMLVAFLVSFRSNLRLLANDDV